VSTRYLTTPIYYVNGDPHIGHAHTSIMSDILKRAYRLQGHRVMLTTGTDEHGQKNQESARDSGLAVDEYLAQQSGKFRALFERLDVGFDFWVRTSRQYHKDAVGQVLLRLREKGLIVKNEYTGLYCVGCEQFKKLTNLDPEGRCPEHQKTPQERTETNYFFTNGKYQQWLLERMEADEDWIQPASYRGEVLAMLREPLEDLCISRPRARLTLGVDMPFDEDYVTYVWFDALLNYISSLDWPGSFRADFWENAIHLMAKDIIKTHCIYWPIMLRAIGLPAPSKYRIHGFWVGEGGVKMAKSLGNVVDPHEVVDKLGCDGLRFYLAKVMRGVDSPISVNFISQTYNTDLANKIGNLYSRVINLIGKNCAAQVPDRGRPDEEDLALQRDIVEAANRCLDEMDLHTIWNYAQTLVNLAEQMNVYVDRRAPWSLAKDPSQKERLDSLLYILADCLRLLFEMAWPIMPGSAEKALANLGCALEPETGKTHRFRADGLRSGTPLNPKLMLFPRLNL